MINMLLEISILRCNIICPSEKSGIFRFFFPIFGKSVSFPQQLIESIYYNLLKQLT